MIEARRESKNESPNHKNIRGTDYSKGDVVLVLRDNGDRDEEGGIIADIENSGRVIIDYGGVISILHDEDQIRKAPDEIKDALALRLKQNAEELNQEMEKITAPLRDVLQRQRDEDNKPLIKKILHALNPFNGYY